MPSESGCLFLNRYRYQHLGSLFLQNDQIIISLKSLEKDISFVISLFAISNEFSIRIAWIQSFK